MRFVNLGHKHGSKKPCSVLTPQKPRKEREDAVRTGASQFELALVSSDREGGRGWAKQRGGAGAGEGLPGPSFRASWERLCRGAHLHASLRLSCSHQLPLLRETEVAVWASAELCAVSCLRFASSPSVLETECGRSPFGTIFYQKKKMLPCQVKVVLKFSPLPLAHVDPQHCLVCSRDSVL